MRDYDEGTNVSEVTIRVPIERAEIFKQLLDKMRIVYVDAILYFEEDGYKAIYMFFATDDEIKKLDAFINVLEINALCNKD